MNKKFYFHLFFIGALLSNYFFAAQQRSSSVPVSSTIVVSHANGTRPHSSSYSGDKGSQKSEKTKKSSAGKPTRNRVNHDDLQVGLYDAHGNVKPSVRGESKPAVKPSVWSTVSKERAQEIREKRSQSTLFDIQTAQQSESIMEMIHDAGDISLKPTLIDKIRQIFNTYANKWRSLVHKPEVHDVSLKGLVEVSVFRILQMKGKATIESIQNVFSSMYQAIDRKIFIASHKKQSNQTGDLFSPILGSLEDAKLELYGYENGQ